MAIVFQIICSYCATVSFGVLTNIPKKALHACGLTGTSGWLVYASLKGYGSSEMIGYFFGALSIGLFSMYFSKKKKMPLIIFNVPSLVPLVPGGAAYQTVRSFVLGDYVAGEHYLIEMVLIATALAAGFMFTSVIEQLLRKERKHKFK